MILNLNLPRTRRIGILVFPGFEPIDVWGFVEAFAIARFLGTDYASPPPYPFEIFLIAEQIKPVRSINGPMVMPDWDLAQTLLQSLDLLMVPGGGGVWDLVEEPTFSPLRDWLLMMDRKVEIMASVCTGAALLAKCGLLNGRPAATNHSTFQWVASHGPLVLWDNVARWVDSGKYVTSAGVSAGTDMGFYLVGRLAGRAVAERAAKAAEYDWHRNPQTPIEYW